jgi:hypothetical protein
VGRAGVLVPAEAEVDYLYLAVLVGGLEQEVLGLEVAVADVLDIVAVGNGLDYLLDDLGGIVLGKVALLALRLGDDPVEQLPSRAKLGDEVEVFLVLVDLV